MVQLLHMLVGYQAAAQVQMVVLGEQGSDKY
jgi:hypothetical protein